MHVECMASCIRGTGSAQVVLLADMATKQVVRTMRIAVEPRLIDKPRQPAIRKGKEGVNQGAGRAADVYMNHVLEPTNHSTKRTCVPADRKVARNTDAWWPSKVRMQAPPSARDHMRMVLSPDAVISAWSTGLNSAAHTPRLWPRSTKWGAKEGSFHTRAVLS